MKEINIYSTDKNGFEKLSNILNGPIKETIGNKEVIFKTVEHAYQVKKSLFANDLTNANIIFNSKTGWDARRLAKNIKNLHNEEWDKVSLFHMEKTLLLSLIQNKDTLYLLLSTGTANLTHKKQYLNLGKWEIEFPKLLMKLRDKFNQNENN